MKKYFILLCIIFTAFADDKKPAENVYGWLQKNNLASLEWVDEEWPNESYHDYLIRCLDYQQHLQEVKKRRIVFKLFHELTSGDPQTHNVLFDMVTAQDLNLFCGQKIADPYLAEIIDRSKTALGKVFLYGLIANPINNKEILINRQSIIKKLIANNKLFDQLNKVYNELHNVENIVLSFWTQDGFAISTERHYFSYPYFTNLNTKLNKSPLALQTRSILAHQQRFLSFGSCLLAAFILPIYGTYQYFDTTLPNPFGKIASHLQGSGGRILALLSSVNYKAIASLATVFAGAYCGLECKEEFEWAVDNVTLDMCLQKKMKTVAQFFDSLKSLKIVLEKNPDFVNAFSATKKIITFFNEEARQNDDLKQLIAQFDTATFHSDPSVFSNQGKVLMTFRLMYKIKKILEPVLFALGEIDAYRAITQLYKESEEKRVHFCFADYKDCQVPFIGMKKFWNPFVNPQKVVPNDIILDGLAKKNMIITGPNAGGKSTCIKGIAINLILAQSIGIAAADCLSITPFYSIATYLNVVDDIAAGNSLFKAQVLRAQQMIELVECTPEGQYSFIALDEMFNGTSAKESKVIAYSVAKHIGEYVNNICVVATHFPLLTQLENEFTTFQNYKVSVTVNPDGSILYPFSLEKGISHQHIALDILQQEGYSYSIIDDAQRLLKKKYALYCE